jgi:DEAD/DEAH box helicase domain-containing protein
VAGGIRPRDSHVERLEFDHRKAYVKRVNVDHYTDAIRYTQVRVLEIAEELASPGPAAHAHGNVLVRSQVVGFKKIKFFTNENIGAGKLELPENEMHTTSFWVTLNHALLQSLPFPLSDRQSGIFRLLHALASMTLARQSVNGWPARVPRWNGESSRPL